MQGFEAYPRNDAEIAIVPGDSADWRDWVSASKTRNWCRQDPLLDWLLLYGCEKSSEQDPVPDPCPSSTRVLLVRSDVLHRLFPAALSGDEASVGAPGLGTTAWHYRVVDAKFTCLKLDRNWNAASEHLEYMAQTYLYGAALARIQSYLPPRSYLLGRGWEKGKHDGGSTNCMDRLAPAPNDREVHGKLLRTIASEAVEWVRKVRAEGVGWDPLMGPNADELRPNISNDQNFPWHAAVRHIAEERDDVTLAWQVGLPGREQSLRAGVEHWTDPAFNAAVAGVRGAYAPVLDRILALNRDPNEPAVSPPTITAEVGVWGESKRASSTSTLRR